MTTNEQVLELLNRISGVETIEPQYSLQEELALDSLSMVSLLLEIEDTFRIRLDESDMNPYDLTTVQSVIDLVGRYLGDEDEDEEIC